MPNLHIYIYIYAVALRWPCACAACVNVCNAGLPKRTPNRNRSICRGEQAAAKVIESIERQQISVREQVVAIIGSPSSTANGRARACCCAYILQIHSQPFISYLSASVGDSVWCRRAKMPLFCRWNCELAIEYDFPKWRMTISITAPLFDDRRALNSIQRIYTI